MTSSKSKLATVLFLSALSNTVFGQLGPATGAEAAPITPAQRNQAISELERTLHDKYVFADVAEKMIAGLERKRRAGAYDNIADARPFSDALTKDLREIGNDLHLRVEYDPSFVATADEDGPTPPDAVAQMSRESIERAGGVSEVRRMPGNVAYLDLRVFLPLEYSKSSLDAAMALVAGSNALILDLRRNGGGEPATVAYLLSYFFPLGDERHLNDLSE